MLKRFTFINREDYVTAMRILGALKISYNNYTRYTAKNERHIIEVMT